MNQYPRMQGKKGKKLKEKRKKENQRKHQSTNGPYVDTSKFMGIDYDDSIFTPWLNEDGTMKDGNDESGEKYTKPSLKKYTKIGTDVTNNFYEKDEDDVRNCSEGTKEDYIEDDSFSDSSELSDMDEEEELLDSAGDINEEELSDDSNDSEEEKISNDSNDSNDSEEEKISNSSDDSEEESSSSDSMPLPLFLLKKNSMDYPPMEVNPLPTKTEHQTRKIFAKSKDKGIIRCFQFLLNNEFINSFTFISIPLSSTDIRSKINRFCEKFDLLMNTKRQDEWLVITVSKPSHWSKKNIKKGKKQVAVSQNSVQPCNSSPKGLEQKTLMEGLSTPIGNDTIGCQLLKKMGWTSGGLGQEGNGIEEPLQIHIKRDTKGIGASSQQSNMNCASMSFIKSTNNSS